MLGVKQDQAYPIAADELRAYVAGHIVGELGYTVLLATHTLTEAEAICHRIAIIRSGRLVENGTMEELRTRMGLSTVVQLAISGASDRMREALRAVPGVEAVDRQGGHRTEIYVRVDERDGMMNRVIRAALDYDAVIEEVITHRPTLDDIYRVAHAEA